MVGEWYLYNINIFKSEVMDDISHCFHYHLLLFITVIKNTAQPTPAQSKPAPSPPHTQPQTPISPLVCGYLEDELPRSPQSPALRTDPTKGPHTFECF